MTRETIFALALGYLLGSIPFGLVLTRLAGKGDIRDIGSGNIGATNVLRTGSKPLAVLTLLLDCLKALLQKGEHDLVFIFPAMEERADMTAPVHCGPRQRHLLAVLRHLSLLRWNRRERWGCPQLIVGRSTIFGWFEYSTNHS